VINALLTLVATLAMLGLLIFVHELGHFLAAKRSGVRVETFSLGFGPRLVGFKRGETDYVLSAIPFGGFVKMSGADPDQEITGNPWEFMSKSRATRAGIVAAGPAMNFLLAVVLYSLLTFLVGVDTVTTRLVGEVVEDSPAWKAGLREGDTVLAVAGDSVGTWDQAVAKIVEHLDAKTDITFERDGRTEVATLDLTGVADPYAVGMAAFSEAVIDNAKIGGPAYEAGLRGGDKIVSIGGEPVRGINDVRKVVLGSPGKDLAVEWVRDGEVLSSTVKPRDLNGVGMIEVDFRLEKRRVGLGMSFIGGIKYAGWACEQFFVFLRHLATFKVSRDMVGGPVRISMLAGEAIRWGVVFFLHLVIFFSAQLSLINLLPIPVLDGGHLLILGVEAARRRSISLKERMVAQQIGLAVLIAAMLALTFNDVSSFFRR
jgi:regulator of sigma E protease